MPRTRRNSGKPYQKARIKSAEERPSLLRIGPLKHSLIRAFEALFFVPVRVSKWLRPKTTSQHAAQPKSILVIEYWQLGDIVILLPFLNRLRRHYPNARITLAAHPKALPLIEGQGLVDEFIPIRMPWAQHFSRWRKYNPFSPLWLEVAGIAAQLRRAHFDLALSGRMDIRDNFLLWLIRAKRRVGYGIGGGGSFLTDVVSPDPGRPHRAEVWLRLLDHLGIPDDAASHRLVLSEERVARARQILAKAGIRPGALVIGIHPGARIPTRQWGDTNFEQVAEHLVRKFSARIVWFCDPQQDSSSVPKAFTPMRLPLESFMDVLSCCDLFVCNDGGPMHIATALGVPVVAVFGPTEPKWFGPIGEGHRIVIRSDFPCRPCFEYCQFDQPYCLREISVDQVFETAESLLSSVLSARGLEAKVRH